MQETEKMILDSRSQTFNRTFYVFDSNESKAFLFFDWDENQIDPKVYLCNIDALSHGRSLDTPTDFIISQVIDRVVIEVKKVEIIFNKPKAIIGFLYHIWIN